MTRPRVWARAVAAVSLLVSIGLAGYAFTSAGHERNAGVPLGPGRVTVTLVVDHSRFEPSRVVVRPHTEVTFRVVNHDPISHELIVGDAEVHARHESGTHASHGTVPGEVSVAPGKTASTTFGFHVPGTVLFACHLPGHFAYGMVGEIVVTRAV